MRALPAISSHQASGMCVHLVTALLTVVVFLATSTSLADALPRVHPDVHRTLRKQGTVNLLVTLAATTESTLDSFKKATFETRSAQLESLKDQLEAHHTTASDELEKLLSQERSGDAIHSGYKSFWISGQVVISAANHEFVEKLAGLGSIASVREQAIAKLDRPPKSSEVRTQRIGAVQSTRRNSWGIDKIGAPQVWAEGFDGQGIVVASIDSGVRSTHEALQDNFRGAYGWYDPELKSKNPYDVDGHGTHTMGTIAGSNGVGVAPGATWMACKGCRVDDCMDADLLECAQFMLCPTDTRGNNADCSKAPRVVSNSWSTPGGDDWFKAAIDAWIVAGIIPVFSQGNTGSDCNTVRSPGDYPTVIAVGASTSDNELASYSARGPSTWGGVKPDISAPGSAVFSAYGSGDTEYRKSSGTSMATPHVAGTIALLLSAQPEYTFDMVKRILIRSADKKGLAWSNSTCGDVSDRKWPNNQWGNGLLNAYDAFTSMCPKPTIHPPLTQENMLKPM